MPNPICPPCTTYLKELDLCMQTKPVSNKSYNEFLVQENKTLPSRRRGLDPRAPVTYVSYNAARKYCQSQGMRLPTRYEYVFAFYKSLFSRIESGHSFLAPHEYVEHSELGNWIAGRCSRSSSGKYDYQFYSRYSPSIQSGITTFRCAVEPETYWAKQISKLVEGLLKFFGGE